MTAAPPLGLVPASIWRLRCPRPSRDEMLERLGEIDDAVGRYRAAGEPAPLEWRREAFELALAAAVLDAP